MKYMNPHIMKTTIGIASLLSIFFLAFFSGCNTEQFELDRLDEDMKVDQK